MLITSGSQRVKASFLLQSSYLQNANEVLTKSKCYTLMIPHRSSIGVGNIDTNMEYLSDFFF